MGKMDTRDLFDDDLPEAGSGRYMRVVQIEYFDTESGDTEELIRVWFAKKPRVGARFEFRGRDWRITLHSGGYWIAEMFWNF